MSHHVEYEGRPPVQQLQHQPRVPAGGHLPHLLPGAAGDTRLTHGHVARVTWHVSRGSSGHGVVTADHGSLHIARCAPRHGRHSTELPKSASASLPALYCTALYCTIHRYYGPPSGTVVKKTNCQYFIHLPFLFCGVFSPSENSIRRYYWWWSIVLSHLSLISILSFEMKSQNRSSFAICYWVGNLGRVGSTTINI